MTSPPSCSSDDEDALLDSLDNDPSLTHLREARLEQLSLELKHSKQQRSSGFGDYTALTSEKDLLDLTTSVEKCIVHFCKPDFNRCRIMDGHLAALAPSHLGTRFLKMDVEHAPFLVTKLNVRVLPCVIAFVDGVSVDRIVGFEGLGYSADTFKTGDLETRLVGAGVLEREDGVEDAGLGGTVKRRVGEKGGAAGKGDDDHDDDFDDDEWD